jgi:hypothetical protein
MKNESLAKIYSIHWSEQRQFLIRFPRDLDGFASA